MQPTNSIQDYFVAWQEHDLRLIGKIFCPDATYVIGPRKKVLNGVGEIIQYWSRNRKRQQNVKISWSTVKMLQQTAQVLFLAIFFDSEERENQVVEGTIRFDLTKTGMIRNLSESYIKTKTF